MNSQNPAFPRMVTRAEWLVERERLLQKEKAATRARDALNAERRRLPMFKIDKTYVFEGPNGKVSLLDLFEGRRQLILYHFMYHADRETFCHGCSLVIDQIGHLAHLQARDTSFAVVSIAPVAKIEAFKKRMGWTVPFYSSTGTEFNRDFGVTTDQGETFGLSVFIRDNFEIFQTYFTDRRGVEYLGSVWTLLDLTPYGRQETWEDSPEGRPQTEPYTWWRYHDSYEGTTAPHAVHEQTVKIGNVK